MGLRTEYHRAGVSGPSEFPKGPSTQYLRALIPNTIKVMVFGTRDKKILGTWILWVCLLLSD